MTTGLWLSPRWLSLGSLLGLVSVFVFSPNDVFPGGLFNSVPPAPSVEILKSHHIAVPVLPSVNRTQVFHAGEFSSILRQPLTYTRTKMLLAYLDRLRPEDFPKALEQVEIEGAGGKEICLDLVIGQWMEVDPEGALTAVDEAHRLESSELAGKIIGDVYGSWAGRDLAGALADVKETLTGDDRKTALEAIVSRVAQTDPAQALALARSLDKTQLDDYLLAIFDPWVARDPKAATEALLQISDPQQVRPAVDGMVQRLLAEDPQTALEWLNHLPDGKIRESAEDRLAFQWAGFDPAEAMKWMTGLPHSEKRDSQIDDIAVEWAILDATWAVTHAGTLPPGKQKESLMTWGMAQWSYNDADAAWAWANRLPPGEKENAIGTVIGYWSEYDPEAATTAALAMPEGKSRQDALGSIGRGWDWKTADPSATAAWLARIPVGPGRDTALESYSRSLLETDPERALQIAATASNIQARQKQLTSLLEDWMQRSPSKATAAVNRSSLPPAVKEQLLHPKPDRNSFHRFH